MGQKTNPIGFRVGINRGWASNWIVKSHLVPNLIKEDYEIRRIINSFYGGLKIPVALSQINIERIRATNVKKEKVRISLMNSKSLSITGGEGAPHLKKLKETLGKRFDKEFYIDLFDVGIKRHFRTAELVAQEMADKLENNGSYRKVQKEYIGKIMKNGQVIGCKTLISGRLNGTEIARDEGYSRGRVPLQTLKADIDYAVAHAKTAAGILGVKVWIYSQDILPGNFKETIIRQEYEKRKGGRDRGRTPFPKDGAKPTYTREGRPAGTKKAVTSIFDLAGTKEKKEDE
jgi:small subunit ribosomal protein S3